MPTSILAITCLVAFGLPEPDEKAVLNSKPVMISGTVVDPDGKPASGVEILLADGAIRRDPNGQAMSLTRRIEHGEGPIDRGHGRSDATGKFRFELKGEPIDETDRVILWAYRPGSLAVSKEVPRKSLGSGDPIEIRLKPPSKTEFLVTDLEGTPIPHAKISATVLKRDWLSPVPESWQEMTGAETDAKGRAAITAFLPEELGGICVTAADFGRQHWNVKSLVSKEGAILVRLLPVGSVKATVLDAKGKGVGGLKLNVSTFSEFIDMDRYYGPPIGVARVTTDADGRFAVPVIPEGKLTIRIRPTKYQEDSVDVPLGDERIWAGKTSDFTIHIDRKPVNRVETIKK